VLLTVAICTRNRANALRNVLTSLAACASPTGAWEVIVVDNGSSDDTQSVLSSFTGTLPVRALTEPEPGLSHARNAAVREALGAYVLWTDDDCLVDQQWLVAYAAAVARWPEAVVFGGPIIPRFDGNPPAWLHRIASRVGTAYAARDLGAESVPLSIAGDRVPFGANYAIRTLEQRQHLYNPGLGRAGHSIAVGEESDVLERLLRGGATGRWVPEARVTHCIAAERQRVSYLRDYFTADGAFEEWRHRGAGPPAEPSTTRLVRQALISELRYRTARYLASPEVWIEHLISSSVARGRIRARRRP
jgi:glucosyl-dolichyl phosphate glucuronosyltransferase